MLKRETISTGTKWEEIVGYSRAVKVGSLIEVTGTVAVDNEGNLVGKDDAYQQTKFILEKIGLVLQKLEASHNHVIRTRMFVTDISKWKAIGKAHGEVYSEIRPCTTMVEVKGLIDPDYLIEIEATAVVS